MFILSRDLEPQAVTTAIFEISKGSDRTAAIVGGAFLETLLEGRLKEHLLPDDHIYRELFKGSGALSSHGAKLKLAKLVGLIGEELLAEMLKISKIRNDFAHKFELQNFNTDSIKDRCFNLKLCESHTVESADWSDEQSAAPGSGNWKIGVVDRDNKIENARGRFITSISVCSFALGLQRGSRMPQPPI